MRGSLEIKPAIAEQVKEIVALDELCFAGIWTEKAYLREINSPNSSLLLLWVKEAESIPKIIGIGCLWAIVEEAHITLLGIHPAYQRRGLGMLLLHSLLTDSIKRNLTKATLEVKVTNQRAINLYEKIGFKIAGKRKNYYPRTGEDALILWLSGLQNHEFQQQLDDWLLAIHDRLKPQYVI